MRRSCTILVSLAAVFLAAAGHARELHWSRLDVTARLDAQGVLHTTERHEMVFDGDWNGGERTFDLRRHQRVDVLEIRRITPSGPIVLSSGGTEEVDHWDRTGDSVRWRSRNPSDPPFANQTLIYEIDYTLTNLLLDRGEGRYLLDHDFAFGDRAGPIDEYTLELSIDPPWRTPENPVLVSARGISPGDSIHLDVPLERTDGVVPTGVFVPPSRTLLLAIAGGLGLGILLILVRYLRSESSTGRRGPLPELDPQAVVAELARWKPEVLGAAWDESVGAPEVAAVLARLVSEGSLETSVSKSRWRSPELEMKLKVPRESLRHYDRALVDAFFVNGESTSTREIRKHYAGQGFDPSKTIEPGVRALLEKDATWRKDAEGKTNWGLPMVLCIVGAAGTIGMLLVQGGGPAVGAAIAFGFSTVFAVVFGSVVAYATSRSPRLGIGSIIGWNIIPLLWIAVWMSLLLRGIVEASVTVIIALGLTALAFYLLCATFARTTMSGRRIELRRHLTALRNWIARELATVNPRIGDEWMPHVLALGLGAHADRWFSRFGSSRVAGAGGFGGGSSSSSSGPGGTWSGGGTSFGGGGATGMWVAAATGVAAGVASPGSGSSSGGGSSSSGGGGGGGW